MLPLSELRKNILTPHSAGCGIFTSLFPRETGNCIVTGFKNVALEEHRRRSIGPQNRPWSWNSSWGTSWTYRLQKSWLVKPFGAAQGGRWFDSSHQAGQTINDLLSVSQCQGNPFKSPWKRATTRTRSQPSCINTHKCTVGKEPQMGLVLAEKILPNMEKRKLNGPAFLDQSKAFVTVNQPVMKLNDLTHAV